MFSLCLQNMLWKSRQQELQRGWGVFTSLLFSLQGRKINGFQISALKISQMGCNYRPICCWIVELPVAEMHEDLPAWSLLSSLGCSPPLRCTHGWLCPLEVPLEEKAWAKGPNLPLNPTHEHCSAVCQEVGNEAAFLSVSFKSAALNSHRANSLLFQLYSK